MEDRPYCPSLFADSHFGFVRLDQPVENLLVENVEVMNTSGRFFEGNLEVVLISPNGTQSDLARVHNHSATYHNWTCSTVKNWGESWLATWTLRLRDGAEQDVRAYPQKGQTRMPQGSGLGTD